MLFMVFVLVFLAWLLLAQRKEDALESGPTPPPASTSARVDYFLSTPLQDIALADVPGVGPRTLEALARRHIRTAEQLLGHFIYKQRSEDAVRGFLRDDIGLQGAVAAKLFNSMVLKADRVCQTGGRGYGSSTAANSSVATRSHHPSSAPSTSAAHEYFLSTPLQDIPVDQVPGVGDKTLPKLHKSDIWSAEALFGYFLLVGRNEERFRQWLKDDIDVHGSAAKNMHDAMRDKADVLCVL